jgi:hypothetical protein
MRRAREPDPEAGFALLVAILFLLIVTAVIAPFVLAARTGLDLAADGERQTRLDLLADGLMTVLAREFAAAPGEAGPASLSSVPAVCRAGRLTVEARVQDQRGLVDLNTADVGLLAVGFESLGLDPGAAEAHARAAEASREPAEEAEAEAMIGPMPLEPLVFDAPDESLMLDGFKRAPFDAVEELYDFAALQGAPLRLLVETFTVHGAAEVVPALAPDRLAGALPPPLPGAPAAEGEGAGHLRLDIFLRDSDGTLGYAGAIVLPEGGEAGGFGIAGRVSNPNRLPGGGGASAAAAPCERLFGAVAAAVLRETG